MKDSLGDRMKKYYEDRAKTCLPRRTYTLIRIDGKAFHSYTRGLDTPFDMGLVDSMDFAAIQTCKQIQGAKFAYVQSDEASILTTDFENLASQAWFDGNVQKIVSISASIFTAEFNKFRLMLYFDDQSSGRNISEQFDAGSDLETIKEDIASFANYFPLDLPTAKFDSRTFTIPHPIEVQNYFIWRQKDCVRNSISAVAQSLYSHKELSGKNTNQMQEMIFQKGINWNNIDDKLKRGRLILKNKETNEWESIAPPIFTQDEGFLKNLIPIHYDTSG